MTEDPITLDEHRGMMAQKATEIRRHRSEFQADQAALRQRQEKFESFLVAVPWTTWPEAAEKARYLLTLFGGELWMSCLLHQRADVRPTSRSPWRNRYQQQVPAAATGAALSVMMGA
jgi:hypothetical protein